MFEYFNYGAFWVLVFLTFFIIPPRKEFPFLVGMLIFVMALLLYGAYSSYSDANSNIKAFKNGDALICTSGGGIHSRAQRYSVSKEDGWRVKKSYFIHNSLMIHTDECKQQ